MLSPAKIYSTNILFVDCRYQAKNSLLQLYKQRESKGGAVQRLFGITLIAIAFSFPLSACKWRDDFRDRVQPQYSEVQAKPTLNRDSSQYVGDKTARQLRNEPVNPDSELPEIDERHQIPELPDQPSGI